jgi:hypothetical protein
MPEAISIATAVTGLLGFIVMARNSISTIINDVDAVRTDTDVLVPAAIRLTMLFAGITRWKTFWRVSDGMPLALFDSYWGPDGRQDILRLLALLKDKAATLYDEFSSKYGSGMIERATLPAVGALAYNEVRETNILRAFQMRYEGEVNVFRRTRKALFQWPQFEKHLKTLEDWLELLHDSSIRYFTSYNSFDEDSEWRRHVDVVSTRLILTRVADRYSLASATLEKMLQDAGGHAVDLYLDHRIDPADPASRMEIFSHAVREDSNSFQYNFCLFSVRDPSNVLVDFSCRLAPVQSTTTAANIGRQYQSFSAATRDLLTPTNLQPCASFRLQASDDVPAFILEKLAERSGVVEDDLHVQCLRTFMAGNKMDYGEELHGPFKSEERWRLAYELAEWALFFLKTNWFSKLCSCSVYRMETATLRTRFLTRIGRIDHVDTTTGDLGSGRQWCEEEIKDMHIRRLGVLLVEIALGFPVPDLVLHPRKGVLFDHELDLEDREKTTVLDRRAINRKIKREMGQDYTDAVDYCLRQSIPPARVRTRDLRSFQLNVVEP